MSTATESDVDLVMTPSLRRVLRRSLFWISMGCVLLIVALVLIAVGGGSQSAGQALSASNPGPVGAKALVEVLRHEGVEVHPVSTLDEAIALGLDPSETTIVVYDEQAWFNTDRADELVDSASSIVLLEPDFRLLDAVAPEVLQAGYVDGESEADCSVPAALKAESMVVDGSGYRLADDATGAACFSAGDEAFSLVQVDARNANVTVLGASTALSNEHIVESGNAALALNLLGSTEQLIWYLPTAADLEDVPLTASELSPDWVFPVCLVLVLTVIAAAFWRGRRMGPLIIENLPVVVRASETMRGRARLYEHSSARLHAIDSLRIGTIERLGRLCGLPRLATVDQVIAAVSATTGTDPGEVRRLLLDAVPGTDKELVDLSDQLLTLERTVASRITPS